MTEYVDVAVLGVVVSLYYGAITASAAAKWFRNRRYLYGSYLSRRGGEE